MTLIYLNLVFNCWIYDHFKLSFRAFRRFAFLAFRLSLEVSWLLGFLLLNWAFLDFDLELLSFCLIPCFWTFGFLVILTCDLFLTWVSRQFYISFAALWLIFWSSSLILLLNLWISGHFDFRIISLWLGFLVILTCTMFLTWVSGNFDLSSAIVIFLVILTCTLFFNLWVSGHFDSSIVLLWLRCLVILT